MQGHTPQLSQGKHCISPAQGTVACIQYMVLQLLPRANPTDTFSLRIDRFDKRRKAPCTGHTTYPWKP